MLLEDSNWECGWKSTTSASHRQPTLVVLATGVFVAAAIRAQTQRSLTALLKDYEKSRKQQESGIFFALMRHCVVRCERARIDA
jgi:hypothetical protein